MQVVIVWAVSRVITTVILLIYADHQSETWQTPERPDLFTFSGIWDGEWYERIAAGGYPSELPRNDEGRVTESAWAFMPVYPMVVRGLMLLTGLPFAVVAVLVSLACGLGAALIFHRLLRHLVDGGTAMFAVALFCIAPVSPMLQLAYAESLQLLFVASLLLLLVERQWLVMAPVIVLASFTRPTGLAWAMTLGLYLLYRWWQAHKGKDTFPLREQLAVAGVTALSVLSGFAWLLTAWVATGEFSAYLDTELAWRSHYTGPGELVPFTAWFHGGYFWIGWAWPGVFPEGSVARTVGSIVIVGAIIATIAVLLALPVMKRLGIEVRLWLISYFTYLVAVFFPQSSTFRLLLPMFPWLGVVALPRSPVYRVAVVVASILGQIAWIHWCWYVIGHDWTPP
ncbi:hypothetical protein F8O04_05900 [Pseudoclavibacter endophyticus]|uniref:DUF2029 domain-containing protein n=1 Tax=Pseudoclavibacter endophyticus TaxID=1778590 RepID=A0A6H9WQV6_9MICO|nr:hypothetical protein F8O04_05900 [Pseudoclavibacter endophyticus]